jgi:hypothetical protein
LVGLAIQLPNSIFWIFWISRGFIHGLKLKSSWIGLTLWEIWMDWIEQFYPDNPIFRTLGIPVTWEGRSTQLYGRAHADDLVAFISNESQWKELNALLDLYCGVSGAVIHPRKSRMLAADLGENGPAWHRDVDVTTRVGHSVTVKKP